MRFGSWMVAGAGAAALVSPAQTSVAALESRHADHILGTSFDLVTVGVDAAAADAAMEAALTEIARLDAVLSGWRADSELAALNDAATFQASPDLYAVIAACEGWRARTDGAFSARLGHVTQAWRDGEAAGRAPSNADLVALAAAAHDADVQLDRRTRTIARPDAVRFDVDALAKGYVVDCVLQAARRATPGLSGLLVDIGGDMRVWTAPWRPVGWRLGIADPAAPQDNAAPRTTVSLRNGALAVSGAGARDRVIAGARHGHVLDPRTGRAITHTQSAAVIAPTATAADAMAAAFMVMPAVQGVARADATRGVRALVIDADNAAHASAGWTDSAAGPCQAPVTASAWPAGFAVTASYEIPANSAANYRKPYVAVWITDENRQLIRTLSVNGPQARWREENYIFWRRFERQAPEAVAAVARPTRAPGKYDVTWDGKDNAGKPVARGKYILNIEASREHGGHSFQSVTLDIGDAALDLPAEASQELGPARVKYGRAP